MSFLSDRIAGVQDAAFDAEIATTATGPNDRVMVLIDRFDGGRYQHGPVKWDSRVDTSGRPFYPTRGDQAQVIFDQEGEPTLTWWLPQAGSPTAGAVTILPNPAVDGQRVDFLALNDGANWIEWPLIYRAAAPGAYKWIPEGGAVPLFKEVTASGESTASTTYVALTTPLALAVPLAGDFRVRVEGGATNLNAGSYCYTSYDIGATGAVDADALTLVGGVGNVDIPRGGRTRIKTLSAPVTLTVKHRVGGGTGAWYFGRSLEITPVRVG